MAAFQEGGREISQQLNMAKIADDYVFMQHLDLMCTKTAVVSKTSVGKKSKRRLAHF